MEATFSSIKSKLIVFYDNREPAQERVQDLSL